MDKSDTGLNTGEIRIPGYICQLSRDKKTVEYVSLCEAQNEQMQDTKRG
jgi:hypothetical protein